MSRRRCVVGIDSSTTSTKAIVVDGDGHVLREARRDVPLSRPAPGRHEQHPAHWWSSTRDALRELASSIDPEQIAAIGLTHQRESFALLDERGAELRPAILWLDARAGAQVAASGSAEVHRLSGKPPDVTPALYKLLWLREHEPEALGPGLARVVDVAAYLAHELTGHWRTSWSSADPLGLLDMTTMTWSPELLDLAGLRVDQLPELVAPGQVLGELREDVARDLGLPPGVPVVAGAGDGQCAGLGAGVTEPGVMYANLGTALAAGTLSTEYRWSRAFRTLGGADPGTYVLEVLLSSGTYLVSWFLERFGPIPDLGLGLTSEQVLEAAAAEVPPGSDGLLALPYWNAAQTPHWDPQARGAVLGWTGYHGRQHLYRALLEGVAFELRLATDGVADETGVPIERYVAMGGGSRSRLWTQMLADVTGRPVTICGETETTALGAAVLAAAAVGLHGHHDVARTAHAMATQRHTVEPDPARQVVYDELFAVYRDVYPALRDVFGRLAAVTGEHR